MTADPIRILEADVSQPIEDVIAKAERQAQPTTEHIEFTITLHDATDTEFHRQRVRFVRVGARLVSAEKVNADIPVGIPSRQLRLYLRDVLSDVPLVWFRPYLQPMRAGDSVLFDVGTITAAFGSEGTE